MIPTCKMNETKLEISESYEDADLSDVEDDVFVRSGGRNGYRTEYDIAKKPLMNPRKKMYGFDNMKNGGLHTEVRGSPPALRVLCMPMCYILLATFAMLGLVAVITFLTSYVSWPLSILNLFKKGGPKIPLNAGNKFLPCDNIEVEDVWIQQFPKLLTESAFRLLDVNKDGVDDVVFGYATGADGYGVPEFVCDIYFNGQSPCFGGVLALDGKTGNELWRHWTSHEVFALNCNEDLNQDSTPDCLVGGRAGVFCAISGSDGLLLWTFEAGPAKNPIMNIYTSQFIRDMDEDGVLDVLAIHGGDPLADPGSTNRLSGRIMIVSGKTGKVLQWVGTPDQKESYYSPQVLTLPDGSENVLFGTGGETHGGGLYIISLSDLYKGAIENARVIYKDEQKGIMVPPVITDVNGDKIDDIIMAMFNSSVVAFDGVTLKQIWNSTFPSSETYSTPTPGYFNEDDVPDFLVKYQYGPGFPIYYHAKTTILDGKTGKAILENPIIDTIGSQASTPLIRLEGYGNDIFLYWSSNCKGFEGNSSEFTFVKGTTVHEQSRSDFCKLRFGSKLINQLRAFNRVTGLPGTVIYDSELRASSEYNNSINTSDEGQAYLRRNPQMWQYFDSTQQYSPSGTSSNKISSSSSLDASDMIPRYPASAMIPDSRGGNGVVDVDTVVRQSPDGSPYIPVYPAGGVGGAISGGSLFDLPSQPELTEEMKYPAYHSVRKHGKYASSSSNTIPAEMEAEIAGGMSNGNSLRDLQINVNRRTHHPSSISHSQDSLLQEEEDEERDEHHHVNQKNNNNNNNDNTMWGNYFPGMGMPSPSNFLRRDEGTDVTGGNDPYGNKNRRGRYRYLTSPVDANGRGAEDVDPNQTSSVGDFASRTSRTSSSSSSNGESVGESLPGSNNLLGLVDLEENIRRTNSNDPYQEEQLQFHHRWRKTADTSDHAVEQEATKLHYRPQQAEQHEQLPQPPPPPSRSKRHIGPHDMDGIQRLISTGTLVTPLDESSGGVDLIFATYWFFPAKTQAILPKDRECIQDKMSRERERFDKRTLPSFYRRNEKCCFADRLGLYADSNYFEHVQRYRNRMRMAMGLPTYRDTDLDFFIKNPEVTKSLKMRQPIIAEWKKQERMYVQKERDLVDEVLNDPTFVPTYTAKLIEFGQNKKLSPDELQMYHSQVQEFKKFLKVLDKVKQWEAEGRGKRRNPRKNKKNKGEGMKETEIEEPKSILVKSPKVWQYQDLPSEVSSMVPEDPNKRNERSQTIDDRLHDYVFDSATDLEDPDQPILKRTDAVQTIDGRIDDYEFDSELDLEDSITQSAPNSSTAQTDYSYDDTTIVETPSDRPSRDQVSQTPNKKHVRFPLRVATDQKINPRDIEDEPEQYEPYEPKTNPPTTARSTPHMPASKYRRRRLTYKTAPSERVYIDRNALVDGVDPKSDEFWGYRSIRDKTKIPEIEIPAIYTPEEQADIKRRMRLQDESKQSGTVIAKLSEIQSHHIPDPYNTIRYNETKPDSRPTIMKKDKVRLPDGNVVEYSTEPTHGLRSLYSKDMAKVISKNQSQRKQLESDKKLHKRAEVEYQIYQDDYRIPKHRFYKRYKEFLPEDYVQEQENWVPCRNCFDARQEADKYNLKGKLDTLDYIKSERERKEQERIKKHGRGKYYRMDHDQYEDTVTNECLQDRGDDPSQPAEYDSLGPLGSSSAGLNEGGKSSGGGGTIYDSQASYNPFDIHMGQMTVYRLHITCSCSESETPLNSDTNKKSSRDNIKEKVSHRQCARILPARDQPWSAYMGTHADSFFPRRSHSSSYDSSSSVPPSASVLRDSVKSSTQTSQLS